MSWGAHQFEIYAVQAHLPRRMRGRVSFFGVWLGDFTPDFLSKFWVYGVTIGGTRYGAGLPHQWHRGWPGMGVTHTLFFGLLVSGGLWLWRRKRALTVGYALGFAAHALTDVNDSVGTMLLFPFSTLNWTTETWSYAATVSGGKYLDAAAYYSSLGLVMDLLWLGVVLRSWRVLTRDYWRTQIVPPDPHGWARLGRLMPERALLALYHATFFYGVCRVVSCAAGPRRRPSRRLPAGSVVDGPVVDRRAVAPPRATDDRPTAGRAAARARLRRGQPPVGTDGRRRGGGRSQGAVTHVCGVPVAGGGRGRPGGPGGRRTRPPGSPTVGRTRDPWPSRSGGSPGQDRGVPPGARPRPRRHPRSALRGHGSHTREPKGLESETHDLILAAVKPRHRPVVARP
jgi:hypothetical protein